MDLNKDITKIMSPIITLFILLVLGINGFNYYKTTKINKFIEIYNEHTNKLVSVFEPYSVKSMQDGLDILMGKKTESEVNINISETAYKTLTESTKEVIEYGCPLLSKMKDECVNTNEKLLDLAGIMYKGTDLKEISKKIKEFNKDMEEYKSKLAIFEIKN